MKRDMDLIRLLLLEREGEEPAPDLSGYSEDAQVYHSVLLIEAGLVNGEAIYDAEEGRETGAVVARLTWAGHEFLEAARDESIWKKAMGQMQKVGGPITLPLLVQVLAAYTKEKLGLH